MSIRSPGNKKLKIPPYPIGTLTNIIYEVPGTLEDWAYAASWEKGENILSECEGID